jgi:hypothetical protein
MQETLMLCVRAAAFTAGAGLAILTVYSAVVTFVLPRAMPNWLTKKVFRGVRAIFGLRLRWVRDEDQRDRVLALFAPTALMLLLPAWYLLLLVAFSAMFWAIGYDAEHALKLSGSSLLTLGFENPVTVGGDLLGFVEATIGLILCALLISYLPTMYAAFARREAMVSMLDVRAGSPPSAVEMLLRYQRLGRIEELLEVWTGWELTFCEIEESHTSLTALPFFRSQRPQRSWITASGAVLDAAALTMAAVDVPFRPQAALCMRAGYLALRHIADFYEIPYPRDPSFPAQPIAITRTEFEEALDQLAAGGVPLHADRDKAWQDFGGWRVNYDIPLLVLAELISAPAAPWSSDRAVPREYTPFGQRNRG